MKKILLFSGLCLSLVTVSFAQEKGYKIGIHGSEGHSSFTISRVWPNPNSFSPGSVGAAVSTKSVATGLALTNQFSRFFAFSTEFNFFSKGDIREYNEGEKHDYIEQYYVYQLELPFYFKGSIGLSKILFLKGYVGGSINSNLSAYSTRTYQNDSVQLIYGFIGKKTVLAPLECCLIAGCGIDFQLRDGSIFSIDAREGMGITELGMISRGTNRPSMYRIEISEYALFGLRYTIPFRLLHTLTKQHD